VEDLEGQEVNHRHLVCHPPRGLLSQVVLLRLPLSGLYEHSVHVDAIFWALLEGAYVLRDHLASGIC